MLGRARWAENSLIRETSILAAITVRCGGSGMQDGVRLVTAVQTMKGDIL